MYISTNVYVYCILYIQALVKYGVVSVKEYEDLFFTDSVDDAFAFIIGRLQSNPDWGVENNTDTAIPRLI